MVLASIWRISRSGSMPLNSTLFTLYSSISSPLTFHSFPGSLVAPRRSKGIVKVALAFYSNTIESNAFDADKDRLGGRSRNARAENFMQGVRLADFVYDAAFVAPRCFSNPLWNASASTSIPSGVRDGKGDLESTQSMDWIFYAREGLVLVQRNCAACGARPGSARKGYLRYKEFLLRGSGHLVLSKEPLSSSSPRDSFPITHLPSNVGYEGNLPSSFLLHPSFLPLQHQSF